MVAVKMFWESFGKVLWKSFSTNFSFSNGNDQKRVSYNRLRPQNKSRSHPANLSSNCSSTSTSSKKDANQNVTNGAGSSSNGKMTTSASYDANGNRLMESSSSPGGSDHCGDLETGWRYDFDSDSDYEDDENGEATSPNPESGDESSDFDDDDEGLTCDVCDRSFSTSRKLADHQNKKRHFGCLQCDSIFPSRQALDHHREQMDHYDYVSDYAGSDTTSFESDEEGFDDEEERERLL